MRFKKQNHSVYDLTYHLVLVTKYRHKCFTSEMMARMHEIAAVRCEDWGGNLIELNGEKDHVHLMFSIPPSVSLSSFINNLKTTSSRLLRKEFSNHLRPFYWKPIFWSRTYCVISTGGVTIDVIRKYIEGQETPTASPPTKRA
jgi:putative transposase